MKAFFGVDAPDAELAHEVESRDGNLGALVTHEKVTDLQKSSPPMLQVLNFTPVLCENQLPRWVQARRKRFERRGRGKLGTA